VLHGFRLPDQGLALQQARCAIRGFWKHKSKAHARKPRLSLETITLIKEMAANNQLWGAERIRGELLKLDIRESQTDHPEVYETGSPKTTEWTDVENIPAQSCGRGMGL
jgi:hypothetical protein